MEEQEIYRTIVPVLMETDPERVLQQSLDALVEVSGAERGCLVLPLGAEHTSFAVEFARGRWPLDPASSERSVSRSILRRTLDKGEVLVLDNALEDPDFMHQESVVGLRLMSVLAIPIWSLPRGPRPIAAIYLDHLTKSAAFNAERVEAVETIAEMLGPRIEQAWRYDQLRKSEIELRRKLADANAASLPVGNSPRFQKTIRAARQVAVSDVPVLLLGESGTGKEVLARMLHELSPFSSGPWVALNCGALPSDLLESELFGHEKGAFTGATAARVGKIASAASGTLFLDEVGELTPSCQTRFLRVLQTGEIQRLGSDRTMFVKVRIIAATNRDLRELIKEGRFREDLFYRLNVVPLILPPLRERGDDILLLAQKFLREYAGSSGRAPPRLDDSARRALHRHPWPGNVRELENAMRRALVFATGDVITLEHLPPELGGAEDPAPSPATAAAVGSEATSSGLFPAEFPLDKDGLETAKKAALAELERRFLHRALVQCGGNLSKVARLTNLNRAVLYDMLKRLDLDPAQFRGDGPPGNEEGTI